MYIYLHPHLLSVLLISSMIAHIPSPFHSCFPPELECYQISYTKYLLLADVLSNMAVCVELFGWTSSREAVHKITLTNEKNTAVELISYGAIIRAIRTADK